MDFNGFKQIVIEKCAQLGIEEYGLEGRGDLQDSPLFVTLIPEQQSTYSFTVY